MSKSKLEYIWLDGHQPTQELRSKTKIENDLRITGDDATDFIEKVVDFFKVDYKKFEIGNYFGGEGFDPLGLSVIIRKLLKKPAQKRSEHDLTLGDLEKWVERGYWVDP